MIANNDFLLNGSVATAIILASVFASSAEGQSFIESSIAKYEAGSTREQLEAVRGLSALVVRQEVKDNDRNKIVDFLKNEKDSADGVVRLAIHVEILKVAAVEQDNGLAKIAMLAADDPNINVRRGILKYYRSFFSNNSKIGQSQKALLVKKLDDPDLETRYQAASILLAWGEATPEILSTILDSLQLKNYRAASTFALVSAKKNRGSIIDELLRRLNSSDDNAAVYINLLSLLTPESKIANDVVLSLYSSENESNRMAVIESIGRLATEASACSKVLEAAVEDNSPRVRQQVLPAMARLELPLSRMRSPLIKFLKDNDESVTKIAGLSLGYFEDLKIIQPDLEKILLSNNEREIISVLEGILKIGPMAQSLTDAVARLLTIEKPDIQIRACWVLLQICEDKNRLIELYHDAIQREPSSDVLSTLIESLSQLLPDDSKSRTVFLNHLNDESEFTRYACAWGLKNLVLPDDVEQIISVKNRDNRSLKNRISPLDRTVIQTLSSQDSAVLARLESLSKHKDPVVRARAILSLGNSHSISNSASEIIVAGLDADEPIVQLAAAKACVHLDSIDNATLTKIFELTEPDRRQQTVDVLRLFASMGDKASAITPAIASLMNGLYRNRYINDAKSVLMKLGPAAAPALVELRKSPWNIQKLDCVISIAKSDPETSLQLRRFIDQLTVKIQNQKNKNIATIDRRKRLFAAAALAVCQNDIETAMPIFAEALDSKDQQVVLALFEKLHPFHSTFVEPVQRLLPSPEAINTLASFGDIATPALAQLRAIASTADPELARTANRAIWNITGDHDLAIEAVQQVLKSNANQLEDIRLKDRQFIWETLRYLRDHHLGIPQVDELLKTISRCRYQNLRTFTKELLNSN